MKSIWKFYRWRDGLEEPWRFLVALLLVTPAIGLFAYGKGVLLIAGAIYTILLVGTRIWFVEFLCKKRWWLK